MPLCRALFSQAEWARFGAAADTDQRWTAAMLKKMKKMDGAAIPTMVCEEILGRRLQDVAEGDAVLSSPAYGESLMRAALFSKRVGAKDFQPYNLMVRSNGEVIQVDINRANALQIMRYNAKGLETSRSFGARFWNPVRRYARDHPVALAQFLAKLVETVPLAEGVRSRLFTQEAQALLLAGRGDAFLQLSVGAA